MPSMLPSKAGDLLSSAGIVDPLPGDPEPEKNNINIETVRKIIQLIKFYEQSMKRAYGKLGLSTDERKYQKVCEKQKSLGRHRLRFEMGLRNQSNQETLATSTFCA